MWDLTYGDEQHAINSQRRAVLIAKGVDLIYNKDIKHLYSVPTMNFL